MELNDTNNASSADDERDRALLARIAEQRDSAAMERLYVLYRQRLVRFLGRLTNDNELIEEAYNDVMLKVWDKAHQFKGQSKVSSWVFSIAYRTCLRMLKKRSRFMGLFDLAGDDLPDLPQVIDQTAQDMRASLDAGLAKLSPKHRLVVELCYQEGCSLEEISQITDSPLNTVKTRLHHARNNLRQHVEGAV